MTTYSDDVLLAYLRGEAPQELSEGIETAVEADADLEARLMSLDPFAPSVADAFATAPPKDRLKDAQALLAQPSAEPAKPNWWGRGLSAIAVAAAGVAGFFVATATFEPEPSAELTWRQQAALYQALYVPETIAGISVTEGQLAGQMERAGMALSTTLRTEDFQDLPGLELKRAQILGYGDKPLIQIAFAGPKGVPYALCIFRRGASKPDARVSANELAGLSAAHWAEGEFAYMLIGGSDLGFVEEVAQQLTELL